MAANVQEYVINFKETGINQILGSLKSITSVVKDLNKISGNSVDISSITQAMERVKQLYKEIYSEQDNTVAYEKIKTELTDIAEVLSKNKIQFISDEEYNDATEKIKKIRAEIDRLTPDAKRATFKEAWDSVMKTNKPSYDNAVAKQEKNGTMPAVGSYDSVKAAAEDKELAANNKALHNVLQKVVDKYEQLQTARKENLVQQEAELKTQKELVNIYKQTSKTGVTQDEFNVVKDVANSGISGGNVSYDPSFVEDQKQAMQQLGQEADMLAKRFFGWQAVIRTLKTAIKELYQVTKELDDAFNGIAVVTNYTTEQVWDMYDAFLGIANAVGITSTEAIQIGQEYFKQGKSYEETLKLTEAAAISAKIAGISASDSINYLTSALNGYNLSANEALTVSDKFAKLASSSASDYEELATAMSKVAAQANASGVEMDTLMGFMTRALEVTREAPENIGTAFKTIFARMSEIKDYGKVLEDNTSANKVSKALDTIGISLFDTNGEMRDLDDVLIDVGYQWKNLNSVQQKYIATALAGTRQQTRLMAIFQDFDRTMELVNISQDSEGASLAQQAKTMESLEYSITRLKNAWEAFIKSLSSTEVFKKVINLLTDLLNKINKISGPWLTVLGIITSTALVVNKLTPIIRGALDRAKLGKSIFEGLSDILDIVGIDLRNITGAIKSYAKGTTLLEDSWAGILSSFNLVKLGITAVAAVIAIAISQAKKMEERVSELYSEIYNENDKKSTISSLIEQYEELRKKIGKTKEELQEMKDLQQQISENSNNLISFDSQGNISGYESYMEDQAKVITDKYKELYQNFYTHKITEDTTEVEKASIIMAETMRLMADSYTTAEDAAKNYYDAVNSSSAEAQDELQAYTIMAQKKLEEFSNPDEMFKEKKYNTKTYTDIVTGETSTITTAISGSTRFKEIAKEASKLAQQETSTVDLLDFLNSDLFNELTEEAQTMMIESISSFNEDMSVSNELAKMMGISVNEAMAKMSLWIDDNGLTTEMINTISTAIENATSNIEGLDANKFNEELQKVFDSADSGVINLSNYYNALEECGVAAEDAMLSTINFYQSLIDLNSIDSDLAAIRNSAADFDSVNEALENNTANFDTLMSLFQAYPDYVSQMSSDIQQFGSIQQSTIAAIQKAEREEYIENLKETKGKLEATQALVKVELDEYTRLYQLALSGKYEQLETEYKAHVEQAEKRIQLEAETQKVIEEIQAGNTSATLSESVKKYTTEQDKEAIKTQLKATMDAYQSQYDSIGSQIAAIDVLLKEGTTNANNFFTGTKESSSEYEKKLDSTYEATQRLAAATQALSKIDALKDLYENRNGLAYKELLNKEEQAIRSQSSAYKDLISAQESAQEILLGKYSAAVKSVFKFENGKLIPIMDKYNALSNENAKSADELVEKYNELSDGINDNTLALIENETKLKEIADTRRDMIINTQEILIEAIKAEQEARLKAAQDALDKEKELLEERKEIYQKAFKEEDYTNELEDTNKQREEIIKQLAALEGANDAKSKQKKIELQAELEELNKTYNDKVTEYNREALLEQIDDEIEANEKASDKLEEDYNKRIEDYAWLQEQIKILTDQGVEACLEYLKTWHDDYINGTTEMREKTEEEWRYAFEAVYGSTDAMDSATKTAMQNICGYVDNAIKKYEELKTAIDSANSGGSGGGEGGDSEKKYHFRGQTFDSKALAQQAARLAAKKAAIKNANEDGSVALSNSILTQFYDEIKYYKTGGYNNYTGLAMLHGTSSNPEAVLNAQDTKNFDQLKSILSSIQQNSGLSSLGGVSIDNITIQTNELNNTQDFAAAGKALGNSLQDILRQRGLVTNLKR